jgi:hypothetical protein
MNLWISPVQFVGRSRTATGTGTLIDVEVLAEQALLVLWLDCRGEGVGTNLERWGNNCSCLGSGSALALSIRKDNREVGQENGSGEEHPHHPTLNKHSEDDANHANDLRN